jgi:hypothetical protein
LAIPERRRPRRTALETAHSGHVSGRADGSSEKNATFRREEFVMKIHHFISANLLAAVLVMPARSWRLTPLPAKDIGRRNDLTDRYILPPALRERRCARLGDRSGKRLQHSGLHYIRSFARWLKRDLPAVRNTIAEPWSNGQAKGQINKYARASVELLRARLIPIEGLSLH